MKKVLIYIGILAAGLLLGYWLFNTSEGSNEAEHDHSEETNQMWTCSMHPQIMQPEPGDCPICGMDLIPAEAGAEGLTADQFKMTENALALANIQTTTVGGGEIAGNNLKLSGKIQVNEETNAVQVAYFAGRIEQLNVNFTGEHVNRGQLLATIYSPELVAAQQELLTAARLKESQPALYKAVRNKLKLWKLSDKQIEAIESSGSVRENFPVYATVAGTVTEKLVQEGDYVKQGQPLYKISNLNSVWAVFDAYENQIRNIKEGQEITITTNAYPERQFNAKVSFIDPVLNTSRRTVLVRADLENKNNIFKPGMFVQGEIETAGVTAEEEVVTIPKSAVLWTGERSLVYIKPVPTEPVFEMREVKLGRTVGDNYEVLEGLQNGDEVVVNGTFTVDAAAQLQGKKSMMNSSEGMPADPKEMKMKLPETFQKDFTTVLSAYFNLKDAFVDSNVEAVKAGAYKMLEEVNSLKTENLGAMEVSHVKEIRQMLQAISENDNLENQRDHFIILSKNMIAFASNLDEIETPVFVQHCPMANTNKGADWLSLSEEVRNPYYGEAMLTCGEVTKRIK
ncbi:membrane fusion protein, Cu(I)/Ag(I) efflux system [Salinimicrobium catena]|uniref:Membrane fusion protein, Cu(I)/Ag(I) efflux system n=1 Tax=Salinimicrobium catena TaxID=390640 RepID=A0A1H5K232_9FLAO|nr:efflux RND transporter periplasmic adaptor subunit [Salinimicrobium catena]SDK92382.1 membrane fusion protein, Cu(I)/Ag(I) efflux system [Salinimicrobium catena]SEE58058.1 membrane fusion protein, Cu(I)/Ag(I) efflux system [Salinimicrobium catena]